MKARLVCFLLLGLAAPAVGEPDDNRRDPSAVDMELPVTARTEVRNRSMSIRFKFKGKLKIGKGSLRWTRKRIAPYRSAARRWLRVIHRPRGVRRWKMTIYVQVKDFQGGLGAASPDYSSLQKIGRYYFPREGEMVISSFTYTRAFVREHDSRREARAEFRANILHEMGHIFGIGSLWNLSREDGEIFDDDEPNLRHWARKSAARGGAYYAREKGLAAYRSIFGRQWTFIPLLTGGDHLFSLEDGDKPRRLPDGRRIPELTRELMANGRSLSVITVGLLDDLGWSVNYRAADKY